VIEFADDAIALPDFNVVAVDQQERQIQRVAIAVALKIVAANDLAAGIDQKRPIVQIRTCQVRT
jgi:hypothetical protein